MSRAPRLHLLAYDIADPRRLRAVAKIAEAHGVRLQRSLFVMPLSPAARARLLAALEETIDPRRDDVRLYPLPARPQWETMGRAFWPDGMWLSGTWPGEGAFDDGIDEGEEE